ncbi:portal protein [Mycobacterium phage Alvin]|uniref:portal protein n=1 Tax=Mycobacterium phage Alvin TaxID=1567466 RepID=UPI000588E7F8|nr:portal protein [Mycobacterium phage Alvin]AJD82517.1 portal protein [Mycobacterium phage Alvin]
MTTYHEHVERLQGLLARDLPNLLEAEAYRNGTRRLKTIGIGAPPELAYLDVQPGWVATYLRTLSDRLDIEGFRISEDSEGLEELWNWWQANDLDEESVLGHDDSLTFGRAYITVSHPDVESGDPADIPLIRVESPLYMYAELDPRNTRRVTRAVRLYTTRDDVAVPDRATLYLPDETVPLRRNGGLNDQWVVDGDVIRHGLGVVPVVPLTNDPRLGNRYGRSEISPELRKVTDAASRTLMNLQSASQILGTPLRVISGVTTDELTNDGENTTLDIYYGRILTLASEAAKISEFKAAELRNFAEEMEVFRKEAASITGLPPQYLSSSSENPASAEAIIATDSRIVKMAERKGRIFGGAWERAMRIAMQIMGREVTEEYTRLETVWRDPSTPTVAAKADAVSKLYANGQGPIPKEQARIDLGYTATQREQMRDWDKQETEDMIDTLYSTTKAQADATPKPAVTETKTETQTSPSGFNRTKTR